MVKVTSNLARSVPRSNIPWSLQPEHYASFIHDFSKYVLKRDTLFYNQMGSVRVLKQMANVWLLSTVGLFMYAFQVSWLPSRSIIM